MSSFLLMLPDVEGGWFVGGVHLEDMGKGRSPSHHYGNTISGQ